MVEGWWPNPLSLTRHFFAPLAVPGPVSVSIRPSARLMLQVGGLQ